MSKKQEKAIDQILDLLLDALSERQEARDSAPTLDGAKEDKPSGQDPIKTDDAEATLEPAAPTELSELVEAFKHTHEDNEEKEALEEEEGEEEKEIGLWDESREPLPTINMNRVFYRMCIALLFIVTIVNIPFNRYGTNLARAMPDERALIVRDGLLFTGPGDEIYILEDNHKRWISSLTAFELHNFQWDTVHEVDQEFVDQFPDGPHLHTLIRCSAQPHIYLLEGDEKRWIQNPSEFEKAGFEWEEVRYLDSCRKLRDNYPDGIPIPPDAGDPPTW